MTTSLETKQSRAIVLVQLGTPSDASVESVRTYLKEFLGDRHVIDANPILWFFILNFIILPFRAKKSALLYERLFSRWGPILRTFTESLTKKIQQQYSQKYPDQKILVTHAMRYGQPALSSVIMELSHQYEHITVVPMFPQFSKTTTGSIASKVSEVLAGITIKPKIDFVSPYYNHKSYIQAMALSVNQSLKERKHQPERLILSYHGLPQRYVDNGDAYDDHCLKTTELLIDKINFPKKDIIHAYQSRFGREPWLQPYLDKTIEDLAKSGRKDIMVYCPSFAMDCLETLDEIAVENRKLFIENHGDRLELIPCLNDGDAWAEALFEIIEAT